MNHSDFISKHKSLLIAPAGYGKTHAIVESLKYADGRQLILTHTHAGVASIKTKLQNAAMPSAKFHVETISGYAQKYVLYYYGSKELPPQEASALYFPTIIAKATVLFRYPILAKVLRASYSGIFVDEYQDCTTQQHHFIVALGEILPIRILGDPMQGIFDFGGDGSMVDLEDGVQMGDFHENRFLLNTPWRWKGQNDLLGEELKSIRGKLEAGETVDLRDYKAIEYRPVDEPAQLFKPGEKYYKDVSQLLGMRDLLLLHPTSHNINARKKVIKGFKVPIRMIEAIDDKDFYEFAKLFDQLSSRPVEGVIYTVCGQLLSRTIVDAWITEKGPKKRRNENQAMAEELARTYGRLGDGNPLAGSCEVLRQIGRLPDMRCYRREVLVSLCDALTDAAVSGHSVYEAMLAKRNVVRRVGRRVVGRAIGTTLLTKGLEFETVAILDAHQFSCRKNLYVALTRACKRLIVFSATSKLSPYNRGSSHA